MPTILDNSIPTQKMLCTSCCISILHSTGVIANRPRELIQSEYINFHMHAWSHMSMRIAILIPMTTRDILPRKLHNTDDMSMHTFRHRYSSHNGIVSLWKEIVTHTHAIYIYVSSYIIDSSSSCWEGKPVFLPLPLVLVFGVFTLTLADDFEWKRYCLDSSTPVFIEGSSS